MASKDQIVGEIFYVKNQVIWFAEKIFGPKLKSQTAKLPEIP